MKPGRMNQNQNYESELSKIRMMPASFKSIKENM